MNKITDFFGIGNAIHGMLIGYFQASRCTGRTVSMLDSLKNGDRIYFANSQEADRVSRICRERDLDVECLVIPVNQPEKIFERGSSQGRAIFDHTWFEQRYLLAIEECGRQIAHIERETSGYGEPHRETRRKAIELSKWRV